MSSPKSSKPTVTTFIIKSDKDISIGSVKGDTSSLPEETQKKLDQAQKDLEQILSADNVYIESKGSISIGNFVFK